MKLSKSELPMDPQIERELEAMVAELEADLGELRPAPSEEFAARLDASAAAGFGGDYHPVAYQCVDEPPSLGQLHGAQ